MTLRERIEKARASREWAQGSDVPNIEALVRECIAEELEARAEEADATMLPGRLVTHALRARAAEIREGK
jgi:hypothetical protein